MQIYYNAKTYRTIQRYEKIYTYICIETSGLMDIFALITDNYSKQYMKIIYSPFFDQGTYRQFAPGQVMLDEHVVGTRGLLAELELRAGMTGKEMPRFIRVVAYYRAAKAVLDAGHKTFFDESFSKDELGVSGELLRWRDALVLTGWTPEMPCNSPIAYKFRDLSLVERRFKASGEPDRWWALTQVKGYLAGSTVEVRVPKSALEKVVTIALEASGAAVSYAEEHNGEELNLKASVKALQFRNQSDAYRWISGRDIKDGTLIVNRNNKSLNDVLRAMGKPLVKSDYRDSNPLTIQLFKLGFGLFSERVDIKTLVAYLNIPVNPLPFKGRMELLRLLTSQGGYGENWNEVLTEYEIKSPAIVSAPNPPATAHLDAVKAYSDELKAWARRYVQLLQKEAKNPDLVSQLISLAEMCEALDSVLETVPELFPYEQLEHYVDGIYSACSFPDEKAQVGSFDIIGDIRAIVEGPEKLIWLDCYADYNNKYPLFFLSRNETDYLQGQGVAIVDDETFVRTSSLAVKRALESVRKEIVFAICRKVQGERADEHPIWTEIKAKGIPYALDENPEMPKGNVLPVQKLQAPPFEFKLEKGIEIPERPHGESYSSIETLIQRPIDYVLDYVIKLRESDILQLADIHTVKGNIAHAVIEQVILDLRDKKISKYTDAEITAIIDEKAISGGVLLYSSKVEYDSFKLKLIQSVNTLLSIVVDNGLSVFDCEHYIEVTLPDIVEGDGTVRSIGKFNARIDLLLQDAKKDFVILDLKWSESSRYRNKVKKQEDLQLQLYAAALETAYPGHKVLGCGYYVIPQCVIETHEGYFCNMEHANYYELPPESYVPIYEEAVRSYAYRKLQLEEGILEGGEGQFMDPETVDYLGAIYTSHIDLYPLEADWQVETHKAAAYGGKNYILKERAL